jgi:5-methylcytosine-specific restriction endonuclease McrBC regulatory subunit McrC
LASIFNTDNIPIEAARIIKKAIDKMKDRKNITQKNLWQAIEYWATDFINGS